MVTSLSLPLSKDKRTTIQVGFRNCLNYETFCRDVLWIVSDIYNFVESENPDFIIFGPYGSSIPKGKYCRIGYYCENIIPNLNCCEWAFGMLYEKDIGNPRYKRLDWHGLTPQQLATNPVFDIDPFERKFANYVYSQKNPHREALFTALQSYRQVDAPGKSMNNMPPLDDLFPGDDMWQRKRNFLRQYKFTMAVENYSSHGYNTEKLIDPLLAGSIPIYWGNPEVFRHINPACFINAHDYLPYNYSSLVKHIDYLSRERFAVGNSIPQRVLKKLRKELRFLKMRVVYGISFDHLIERIREVDADRDQYMEILNATRMTVELEQTALELRNQWIEIFSKRNM